MSVVDSIIVTTVIAAVVIDKKAYFIMHLPILSRYEVL